MPRPPTPTSTLKLTGAFRADRHGDRADIGVTIAKCTPPAWMSDESRAQFEELAAAVEYCTTAADSIALAMLTEALMDYRRATAILTAEGMVIKTSHGPAMHPAARIARDAWERALSAMKQFGMTPASRGTIKLPKAKAPESIKTRFFSKSPNERGPSCPQSEA